MAETFDVIVIGGGAAGLMCALTAGQRGRRVLLLEGSGRVGKKILMSGGGRCNFTNTGTTPANYLSANPHFCKSALARYSPGHFIAMVEAQAIAYHEKELGQLFCNESALEIVQMLLAECSDAGVRVVTGCQITAVQQEAGGDRRFALHSNRGSFAADALVVACGGLSIPRMGASGFGYELARQFGHSVLPTRAGLVPLVLTGKPLAQLADLSGVSVPVTATCKGMSFSHSLLITHRGVSGPAILQISSYSRPGDALQLNWLPTLDALDRLQQLQRERPAAELKTVLAELLPKRLVQRLCETGMPNLPMRQFNLPQLRELAQYLQQWPLVVSGSEGYRTAEVTLGGVDTRELSSTTMQSKRVPGLYFIGEVLDVTGWLGGYNFQWAWASGHAAGVAV